MQIIDVSSDAECGSTEVAEILRVAEEGVLRPLMCKCSDGRIYFFKPLGTGGWPLCLEWVCARLGRALGLRIPNYRQVRLDEDLASAWNEQGYVRQLEPGVGFGSQAVANPSEIDAANINTMALALRHRIIWFDWWIRNSDRRRGRNPNALWSSAESCCYLFDHEKAGDSGDSTAFWLDHLCASARGVIDPALVAEMRTLLSLRHELRGELPSAWTSNAAALDWFFTHLETSLTGPNFGNWTEYHE